MRPRRSISFLLSPKRLSESVSDVMEVIEPWLDLGGYPATGGGIVGSFAISSTSYGVFSIESHIRVIFFFFFQKKNYKWSVCKISISRIPFPYLRMKKINKEIKDKRFS